MSSIYLLEVARDIVREHGWTQGAFARDSRGKPVAVLSEHAATFSMIGAITRAAGGITEDSQRALSAYGECIEESILGWEDHVSFGEMMAHLDETLATLKSRNGSWEGGEYDA